MAQIIYITRLDVCLKELTLVLAITKRKMKNRKVILLLLAFLACFTEQARTQQINILNTSLENHYILNPALSGQSKNTWFNLHYRNQWQNMPGSPKYLMLSVNGSINDRVGAGFQFYNDETDVIAQSGFFTSYSYKTQIQDEHMLSFGLSFGLLQNRLLFDKVIVENNSDPNLYSNDRLTRFNANVGAVYQFKGFSVGLASYQLLENEYEFRRDEEYNLDYRLTRHYVLHGAYDIPSIENIKLDIKPFAIARTPQGLPAVFDLGSKFEWNKTLWTDLFYRTNKTVGVNTGIVYNNQISIGFSFEINNSYLAEYGGSSTEIMIGFSPKALFPQGNPQGQRTTVSEKSKENIIKEAESKKHDNEDIDDNINNLDENIIKLQAIQKREAQEYDKLKARHKLGLDEIVNDSENLLIVIGAFSQISDAKKYQKSVARDDGRQTFLKINNEENMVLIYSKQVKTEKEAQKELKKLQENNVIKEIFSESWIYKN